MNQKKVLLISMPWSSFDRPSIQIGVLSSYLIENGIEVDTKHYYLQLVNKLGPGIYSELANCRFKGTVLYSELLYDKKEYTYKDLIKSGDPLYDDGKLDFKDILEKIKEFHNEVVAELNLELYDIIGFTVGYQQEVSSLSLAKVIKEKYPDKLIVIGGACVTDELGKGLIKAFPYIDIAVTGEGEEVLLEIVKAFRNGDLYKDIIGICYREGNGVIKNPLRPLNNDLNKFPSPIYDEYFETYEKCSNLQQFSQYTHVKLPIEGSRGCWWNRCAFCGFNIQFIDSYEKTSFRKKKAELVIEELKNQKEKYQTSNFAFLDNTQVNIEEISEAITKTSCDYSFFTECRADVTPKELIAMKEMGFDSIQIGVESLSDGLLIKMDKGATALQNVYAMKWANLLGIETYWNIIKYFPTEEEADVQEIIDIAKRIFHLTPPGISPFILDYKSPVYQNPEKYNIKNVRPLERYKYVYNQESLEHLITMSYDFDLIKPLNTDKKWHEFDTLREVWLRSRRQAKLVYRDGGTYLNITDTRYGKSSMLVLDEQEREIYLYCSVIRSIEDILKKFSHLNPDYIQYTLKNFENSLLMLEKNGECLNLAIPGTDQSLKRLIKEYSKK